MFIVPFVVAATRYSSACSSGLRTLRTSQAAIPLRPGPMTNVTSTPSLGTKPTHSQVQKMTTTVFLLDPPERSFFIVLFHYALLTYTAHMNLTLLRLER